MKNLLSILHLILFAIIFSFFTGDIKADSNSAIEKSLISEGFSVPAMHSRGEILKEIKSFDALSPGEPFSIQPLLQKPFKAGELNSQFLNNGLASVNLHRFLAGLPYDIKLNNDWNFMAQHGAALLAIMKKGSHTPEYPVGIGLSREFYNRGYTGASTSNLHSGQANLAQAVTGFVHDSDSGNIDRLGHRRWVLDPGLSITGFGFVNGYVLMKVFDHGVSSTRKEKFAYSAWPPAGEMPISYFLNTSAWSFSLNPLAFGGGIKGDVSEVTVTLSRSRDGRTWTFGGTSGKSDGYFNIDKEGFGLPYCIIFRPDNPGMIKDNDTFDVEISGITSKDDKIIPVKYRTVFFNDGEKIVSDAVSKKPSELTIDCNYSTAKYGKQSAAAKNGQIIFGYTGAYVRGFSVTADSPDGIIPVGFSINKSGKIFGPGEWVSDGDKEITSLRVFSSGGGYNVKFTIFCKEKGWSSWGNAGDELSFGPSHPIESISILISQD